MITKPNSMLCGLVIHKLIEYHTLLMREQLEKRDRAGLDLIRSGKTKVSDYDNTEVFNITPVWSLDLLNKEFNFISKNELLAAVDCLMQKNLVKQLYLDDGVGNFENRGKKTNCYAVDKKIPLAIVLSEMTDGFNLIFS